MYVQHSTARVTSILISFFTRSDSDSDEVPEYHSPTPEVSEEMYTCCDCKNYTAFHENAYGTWVCENCGHEKTDSCDCY
jgi:hypothetical protein